MDTDTQFSDLYHGEFHKIEATSHHTSFLDSAQEGNMSGVRDMNLGQETFPTH
jgi:hypothetical protein